VNAFLPILSGSVTGAAGPFDPQTQGTLVNWYDISVLGLANGASITTCTDSKTGNPNPLTTSGSAPKFATNQQNSLSAATFNGVNEYWNTGGSSASAFPYTIAAVFTRPNATAQYTLVGSSGTGGIQLRTDTTTGTVSWVKTGTAVIGTSSGTVGNSAYHAVIATVDASSYAFTIDGVAAGSGAHAQTLTAARTIHIGGTNTGAEIQTFLGSIGEVQIYSSVLSSGDLSGLWTYLDNKWNL
jgi:hypothetical protein